MVGTNNCRWNHLLVAPQWTLAPYKVTNSALGHTSLESMSVFALCRYRYICVSRCPIVDDRYDLDIDRGLPDSVHQTAPLVEIS
jgi:hypothetical protein